MATLLNNEQGGKSYQVMGSERWGGEALSHKAFSKPKMRRLYSVFEG